MTTPAGKRSTLFTFWRDAATVPDSTANTGQMVESKEKIGQEWGKLASALPPLNAAGVRGQTESWQNYHMNVDAKFVITVPYSKHLLTLAATDWATSQGRTGETRYNIAGKPMDDGGDLIIPVSEVV